MRNKPPINTAISLCLGALLLIGLSTDTSAAVELEEIKVLARKREVTLQDAAIAVSVVSGETFDRSNIIKLDNLNGFSPGLVVAKNDGAGRVITIRGTGWETAQNIASQPGVLTYLDGIYLANPLAAGLDLGEVERLEVYRGPQGTEFGQGTTGGSINIVTRKPEPGVFNAYAEGSYGSFNHTRVRGAVNLPLGKTAALRASIQKYDRDGFAEIRGGALDGYDLDDADSITGKIALLWQPADGFTVLARGFIHDSDQHAAAQKNIDDPNPDVRELTQDFPGIFALRNYSASLTLEWQTPWGLTLTSLSGWQQLQKRQTVDGDRLTEATISIDTDGFGANNNWDVLSFWDNDSDAVSQEINATYSGTQLDWTAGFYYLAHDNLNDFLEAAGATPFSDSVMKLANPGPDTLPPFNSVLRFHETREVQREDLALYGQATYRINDIFALTAGLRYQTEDQRDFGVQFFTTGFDRNADDSQLTWTAGLDMHLTPDHLLYGRVTTGWKNGGTNPGSTNAILLPADFPAEEVTAYEIGNRNTLLNNTLHLNLIAFFHQHKNLQYIFEDPIPFAGGTSNIPETEEYGIETEFNWQINPAWRLDGSFAWQDGKINSRVFALDVADFRAALAPGTGLFTDAVNTSRKCDDATIMADSVRCKLALDTGLNGNEPPKLPDVIARLALSNEHSFADGSVLGSQLEYVHRGKMQARVFNNPVVDRVPAYDVVNLHIAYTFANLPVSIRLSATNLLDEDGFNNTFTNPYGLYSTSSEFIPPREVIATLRYDWN